MKASFLRFFKFVLSVSLFAIGGLAYAQSGSGEPTVKFKTIFSFNGTDGSFPNSPLVQGPNGDFYGTDSSSVIRITPAGVETVLFTFPCELGTCPEGGMPAAGLVLGKDGNFYGTAGYGGTGNVGTVFKITPAGVLTTLHNFDVTDGAYPGAMIQAADGNLYGVTPYGGTGFGTVFRISPSGSFKTIYSFCSQLNCTDGTNPGGMFQASNGNFYGVTGAGGANGVGGTIFTLTPAGVLTTLHSFCADTYCVDGNIPSGLVLYSDGNLYGTTLRGGTNSGNTAGTFFQLTPNGKTFTTLYEFCSLVNCADGAGPGLLIVGTDNNIYGVSGAGDGTIFEATTAGVITTLHVFDYDDGAGPGVIVQDTDGVFYGTTNTDGIYCACGTIYGFSVGLGPFVRTNPTSGVVGSPVTILGTKLTGATSVSFNGTPASFTVISASEIKTTVPANATTGTVQVTTPAGTLNSNVVFRVKP